MSPAIANLVRILVLAAVEDLARTAHRPADRAALEAEARRLAASGLTARDIAGAMQLTEAAARDLLEPSVGKAA